MQECNNNPIFWEALQAFLRKYKNSPTHIQQVLGDIYVDIPDEVVNVYIQIVKYGSEQVLDFNYFENSDEGIILLNDLISGTSLTTQEVLDYFLPILRMLKSALEIIADSITEK